MRIRLGWVLSLWLFLSGLAALNCAARPELVVQTGHADGVRSVVFNPNGRLLASAGGDNTVRIWDLVTGKELRVLAEHTESVTALAFAPGGATLASGGMDNTVRVWDPLSGRESQVLAWESRSILGGMEAVAYSPDGQLLAAANSDGRIRIWDTATGNVLRTLEETVPVHVVAFHPDGRTLASGGDDNVVKLWNVASGKLDQKLAGHDFGEAFVLEPGAAPQRFGGVYALAFSSAGDRIASGGRDKTSRIWDAKSGKLLHTLAGAENTVVSVAFSPDGKQLATTCGNRDIKIWDARDGTELRTLQGHSGFVRSVAFSPDGKNVASGSEDRSIRLWDAASGREVRSLAGRTENIDLVAFSPGSPTLFAVAGGKTIRRWDLASGRHLPSLRGHAGTVVSLAFSPNARLLASGSWDPGIKLWNLPFGTEIRDLVGHTLPVQSVAFSPDGQSLASASWDKTIRIWDPATGQPLQSTAVGRNGLDCVLFSPDGKGVVCTEVASDTKLWDLASGRAVREFKAEAGQAQSVLLSPDGRILAGRSQNVVLLWDFQTGRLLERLGGHAYGVKCLAFSPDGHILASGSDDQTVKLWDTRTLKEIRSITGNGHWTTSTAFSPDGRILAVSSANALIKLWEVATGKELATLVAVAPDDFVIASANGYYMASRGALRGVAFRVGTSAFPFEQFDLRLNRPDKVLESLQLAPLEMLEAYRTAYRKRLEKLKFTPEMLGDDFHLPEVEILNSDLPVSTPEKRLAFKIHAMDSKRRLDRLNLDVNDVPVSGSAGFSLRGMNASTWEQELQIELSTGRNKIQVSALNDQGVESLRRTIEITCDRPAEPPALHVVVIGVSDYRLNKYKLRYAAKDADDLARTLEDAHRTDGKIRVLRLLNADATKENILAARKWLLASKVDDSVIVFLAGHGMLDRNYNYYFGTVDIDLQNPPERGLPYEMIEGLVDGIPARHKLLLMDTCHAGEVDREELASATGGAAAPHVVSRSFPVRDPANPSRVGLHGSFELLQELFADLRRGSGAAVIAAAGGLEFSFEGERWKNGVFTYSVLEGLRERKADRNGDGQVRVSELRDYVFSRVQELTRGQQKPVSRRENLETDFVLH